MSLSYSDRNLRNYSFKNRNLENADFSNSDIRGCNFSHSRLKKSNFKNVRTGHTFRQILFTLLVNLAILLCMILSIFVVSQLTINFIVLVFSINIKSGGIDSVARFIATTIIFILPGILYWVGSKVWWGFQLSAMEILLSIFGWIIWVVVTEPIPNLLKQEKYIGIAFYLILLLTLTIFCLKIFHWMVQLIIQKTSGTSFKNADISYVNFQEAKVFGSDFSYTVLNFVNWKGTIFRGCNFGDNVLENTKVRSLLTSRNGRGKSYRTLDLRGLNLIEVDLEDADLIEANLSDSNLHGSNLQGADLSYSQALGTDFSECKFTKVILDKEWSIDSKTSLDEIDCQYVYINTSLTRERFPRGRKFNLGEFTEFFKQTISTVDLLFEDGIDWQAFFQSLWEIKNKNEHDEITFQGIDRMENGVVIIKINIPPTVDKSIFKDDFWQEYQEITEYYSTMLGENREVLQDVKGILKSLPESITESIRKEIQTSMSNQPKYNIPNAEQVTIIDNFENHGTYIVHQHAKRQDLKSASEEIQELLKRLSDTYGYKDIENQFSKEIFKSTQLQATLLAGGIELIKLICQPLSIPIEMGKRWLEIANKSKDVN